MATEAVRLRINLSSGEMEVEGPEAFVQHYSSTFDELLERLRSGTSANNLVSGTDAKRVPGNDVPTSFGEYLLQLPRSSSDVERMLAAGHFAQLQTDSNSFSTGEANKLLLEQGVRLANPSDAVGKNLKAKRVFVVQKGRYRVSQAGVEHLHKLISGAG